MGPAKAPGLQLLEQRGSCDGAALPGRATAGEDEGGGAGLFHARERERGTGESVAGKRERSTAGWTGK